MRSDKDWSYFEFQVGRYEPHCFVSEREKKSFIPYKPQTKKLEWFVFAEDINTRKIVPVNVFNGSLSFTEGLLEAKKKYKDNYIKFAEKVRRSLSYAYWSKCEWETNITDNFVTIDNKELDRIIEERDEHIKEYGYFYRTSVRLEVHYKIDVYTQVMMNWDRFIEYVWNNKRLITKKKLGISI